MQAAEICWQPTGMAPPATSAGLDLAGKSWVDAPATWSVARLENITMYICTIVMVIVRTRITSPYDAIM